MDNITHGFLGAAMAECALPRRAAPGTRAAFMCAGVIAANAPDVDLLYNGIVEQPLGYLLHHRGHSHTLPGLLVLGVLMWSGFRLWPRARLAVRGAEGRWLALVSAALASHLLMDTANGYGTHLWYPFSSGWVYGDAVFVLEPWLWGLLGAAVAMNAGRVWRVVSGLLTLLPIGALVYVGLLQAGVAAVLLAVVAVATGVTRQWPRATRAAAALVATASIVMVMSGVSRLAKEHARREIVGPGGGAVIDVTADANPAVPWCWAVLVLQAASDEPADALVATRATLSLVPRLWPATSCASARLGVGWTIEGRNTAAVVWHRRWHIDAAQLRALYRADCRARAWLQFGRVPYVSNGSLVDLRFENPIGQNFTPMAVDARARACPAYLTSWDPPRRDLLEAGHR